jgi:hypothetical protein
VPRTAYDVHLLSQPDRFHLSCPRIRHVYYYNVSDTYTTTTYQTRILLQRIRHVYYYNVSDSYTTTTYQTRILLQRIRLVYYYNVSDSCTTTTYLIRGFYTFRCRIINHVSGLYVPSFHVTHILIRVDPVHATYPSAISICDGMSPTPHHSLHRARKISCHNSRTLA